MFDVGSSMFDVQISPTPNSAATIPQPAGLPSTMKIKSLLPVILLGFASLAIAEPSTPLLAISAKQRTLDKDHDFHGKHASSTEKTIGLRVEIVNTSSATVPESELTGTALVSRAGDFKEKVVKESLGVIKVPAMKPNEKLTFDLGKIELKEIEWKVRKFEETLSEWQVVCTQGGNEIGKTASSDRYSTLLEEVAPGKNKKAGRVKRGKGQVE